MLNSEVGLDDDALGERVSLFLFWRLDLGLGLGLIMDEESFVEEEL